jgi:hypothetical protein
LKTKLEAVEGVSKGARCIKLNKLAIADKAIQFCARSPNTFTMRVFSETGDKLNDDINWNTSMGGGSIENPLAVEAVAIETETTTSGTFSCVVETERVGSLVF